jgi:NADP-dependent 3-hydroxy acid dehydrogenase YdfG
VFDFIHSVPQAAFYTRIRKESKKLFGADGEFETVWFAAEEDFDDWCDRLHVFGLDLRHTPSVEAFAKHINGSFARLDFILHNACQTVRRPPAYSAHLMEGESIVDLDPATRLLLRTR